MDKFSFNIGILSLPGPGPGQSKRDLKGRGGGVRIPVLSIEIIQNSSPNMKKRKIPSLETVVPCNDQRSLLNSAGGLGVAVRPPVGPGQSSGGGSRERSPLKLRQCYVFGGLVHLHQKIICGEKKSLTNSK